MASVQEESQRKKGFLPWPFHPWSFKLPLRALAVLVLAVTAFYLYSNNLTDTKRHEVPSEQFPAAKSATSPTPEDTKRYGADGRNKITSEFSRPRVQAPQTPTYKALAMKPEYEAPKLPEGRLESATPGREEKLPQSGAASAEAPAALSGHELSELTPGKEIHADIKRQAASLTDKPLTQAQPPNAQQRITAAGGTQSEEDDIKMITAYFLRDNLPAVTRKDNLKFTVTRIHGTIDDMQSTDKALKKTMESCKTSYRVDVENIIGTSTYVYCIDNSSITLLGTISAKRVK